jgi:hypothetical protein
MLYFVLIAGGVVPRPHAEQSWNVGDSQPPMITRPLLLAAAVAFVRGFKFHMVPNFPRRYNITNTNTRYAMRLIVS